MGRFCDGLLTAFRFIQFLLSVTVLGCGAYIVYMMYSMSSSAHQIEDTIALLLNGTTWQSVDQTLGTNLNIIIEDIETYSEVLNHTLIPVLHFLEGTPFRAILVAATGLWSTSIIIYLYLANKKKNDNPNANKRWIRITLEILTLLFWLVGIICAVMLALEYGVIALAGGTETKVAFDMLKPLLKELLEKLVKSDNVLRSLSIVDDIVTIGIMAILTAIAACVCWLVSLVSLFVACCSSGKAKSTSVEKGDIGRPFVNEKYTGYSLVEVNTPSPSSMSAASKSPVSHWAPVTDGWGGRPRMSSSDENHRMSPHLRHQGGYRYYAV